VNESFCQITGYCREDVINHRSLDLNIWVSEADYHQFYDTFNLQGTIRNYELNFRTKSGEVRTGLLSADKITIHGEELLLSASLDITERKRAEAALKRSEETLKQRNLELEKARKVADTANRAKSTF
jgi:PAS domain S-box-containing protein